ncbi:MAG: hypothetical protein M3Z26_07295 [Bacteroidota bacterium]|nr:hypothetical protein [Bacteroidota bacterium]
MQRILTLLLFTVLSFSQTFGQVTPSDKHIMDSLLQNDDFFKMMNDNKATSYLRVNVGISNKLQSQNKAITSLQNSAQFVLSPSIGYYHKSGLGISFTGYLFDENNKTDFYQYALSPSYNYTSGKVVDASVYYTHYFQKDVYNAATSPIQNEIYGSLVFKKSWLKPGIAAGFSAGRSHQIINIDTTIKVQNQHIRVKYTDTADIQVNSFTISPTIEHDFEFTHVFSSNDGLSFIPQFSLITGINKYVVNHKSTQTDYNNFTKKKIKRIKHFQTQSGSHKYELQSIALDLYANYSISKFYIEPEVYLDYFLPKTTDNRFSQIFSLNIGMTF